MIVNRKIRNGIADRVATRHVVFFSVENQVVNNLVVRWLFGKTKVTVLTKAKESEVENKSKRDNKFHPWCN